MNQDLRNAFLKKGGILQTKDLRQLGYYYQKIQELLEKGEIEQIRHGYYQYIDDDSYSDISILKALFPDGVLCRESALDYYGYTERTPSAWHIAVDRQTSRRRFQIDYPIVKPHFVVSDKFSVGIEIVEIEGSEIQIYDRERTICDCLKHRNKLNAEVFNGAIQCYLADGKKNEGRLGKYASVFHVDKKVRGILGIWL